MKTAQNMLSIAVNMQQAIDSNDPKGFVQYEDQSSTDNNKIVSDGSKLPDVAHMSNSHQSVVAGIDAADSYDDSASVGSQGDISSVGGDSLAWSTTTIADTSEGQLLVKVMKAFDCYGKLEYNEDSGYKVPSVDQALQVLEMSDGMLERVAMTMANMYDGNLVWSFLSSFLMTVIRHEEITGTNYLDEVIAAGSLTESFNTAGHAASTETNVTFSQTQLEPGVHAFDNGVPITRKGFSVVTTDAYRAFVAANAQQLDAMMCYMRDYRMSLYGICNSGKIYSFPGERYADTLMRVAVWHVMGNCDPGLVANTNLPKYANLGNRDQVLHPALGGHTSMAAAYKTAGFEYVASGHDDFIVPEGTPAGSAPPEMLDEIRTTYEYLSRGGLSAASPSVFNAAKSHPQLSSCFLESTGDEIEHIIGTMGRMMRSMARGGGTGLLVENRRNTQGVGNGPGRACGATFVNKIIYDATRNICQGPRASSTNNSMRVVHPGIMKHAKCILPGTAVTERCTNMKVTIVACDAFMHAARTGTVWHMFEPGFYDHLHASMGTPGWSDLYNATVGAVELLGEFCPNNDTSALTTECITEINQKYPGAMPSLELHNARRHLLAHVSMNAAEMMMDFQHIANRTGDLFWLFAETATSGDMMANREPRAGANNTNLCTEVIQRPKSYETAVCSIITGVPCAAMRPVNRSDTAVGSTLMDWRMANDDLVFDLDAYRGIVERMVYQLDRTVATTQAPTEEADRGLCYNRSLGMGFIGGADFLIRLGVQMDTQAGRDAAARVFMWTNLIAITTSAHMARKRWMECRRICRRANAKWHRENADSIAAGELVEAVDAPGVTLTLYRNPDRAPGFENVDQDTYEHEVAQDVRDNWLKEPLYIRCGTYKVQYRDESDIPTTIGSYPAYLWNGGCPRARAFHYELHTVPRYDADGNLTRVRSTSDEDIIRLGGKDALESYKTARALINKFGTRHCQLMAPPPSFTSSPIVGLGAAWEYPQGNLTRRNVGTGTYPLLNPYLAHALRDNWNLRMCAEMRDHRWSPMGAKGVPLTMEQRLLLRSAHEYDVKSRCAFMGATAPFVDQAQSNTVCLPENPTLADHLAVTYSNWYNGNKTIYYQPTRAASNASDNGVSGTSQSFEFRSYDANVLLEIGDTSYTEPSDGEVDPSEPMHRSNSEPVRRSESHAQIALRRATSLGADAMKGGCIGCD